MSRELCYIPNGEQCILCVNAYNKCNHLPFNKMRVIASDCSDPGVELLVVKCEAYKKAERVGFGYVASMVCE